MKKKIKSSLCVIIFLFIAFLITGCSKTNKNADEIRKDLENTDFSVMVSETFEGLTTLTKDKDYNIECIINEVIKDKDRRIYNCSVVCSNSDFKVEYDVKVVYKSDDWDSPEYKINDKKVTMIGELPEDQITNDISTYFAHLASNKKRAIIDEGSISQEVTISDDSFSCNATATGKLVDGLITEECTFKIKYSYFTESKKLGYEYSIEEGWQLPYVSYTRESSDWDIKALEGKKWVSSYDDSNFVYIESVDETNSKMMIGFVVGLHVSTLPGPGVDRGAPAEYSYRIGKTNMGYECIEIVDGFMEIEIFSDMGIILNGYTVYPTN